MNRRSFITGMGASLTLASLPSAMGAQVSRTPRRKPDVFDEPSSDNIELPNAPDGMENRYWEYSAFGAQYITVERYWLGAPDLVEQAVFGDVPLESVQCPVVLTTEVVITRLEGVRAHVANLWGEDIRVVQVHVPDDEFVWIVTGDDEIDLNTISMVVNSVTKFDEPRIPRDGWYENTQGRIN